MTLFLAVITAIAFLRLASVEMKNTNSVPALVLTIALHVLVALGFGTLALVSYLS